MFNDRKAVRFSNRKYRVNIISEELYEKWKESTGYDITFKQFKAYWKLIGQEYVNSILEEADGAKLGASLGDIYMGFVQSKKKPVDFKTSLELGRKVHFQNWNSQGKLGKIIYGTRRRKYIYRLFAFWAFKACTTFREKAQKGFAENPERYKNSIEKRSLLK